MVPPRAAAKDARARACDSGWARREVLEEELGRGEERKSADAGLASAPPRPPARGRARKWASADPEDSAATGRQFSASGPRPVGSGGGGASAVTLRAVRLLRPPPGLLPCPGSERGVSLAAPRNGAIPFSSRKSGEAAA